MMSKSGGLNPRAVAGRPSVTRLTQRSCTGMSASGIPRAAVKKIQTTCKSHQHGQHNVTQKNLSSDYSVHLSTTQTGDALMSE